MVGFDTYWGAGGAASVKEKSVNLPALCTLHPELCEVYDLKLSPASGDALRLLRGRPGSLDVTHMDTFTRKSTFLAHLVVFK